MTARDGRRAEKVLVNGAREKVVEMEGLSREMGEWSLLDEAGDMPMRTTIGTKGSSSAIVKGSGLTAITVFLRMPARMPVCSVTESARGGSMTLGELFEETYIQGEIAIRSYDSTGTTIEHYLGNAEEFYPDEHPQILEREVGYIFPLMEVEPTICIELKDEG